MNYTQKEILDALELIKNVCWDHVNGGCEKCPFYSGSFNCCIFKYDYIDAKEWTLNTPERNWHAVV